MGMPCFVCKKDLMEGDEKFMVPLDVPYANLFIHRDCWNENRDNYPEFIVERKEYILSLIKDTK